MVPETRHSEEVRLKQNIEVDKLTFDQSIIFSDAKCGEDEIYVEILLNGRHEVLSWDDFENRGFKATTAVVEAKWSCGELQKLAQSFQNRQIEFPDAEEKLNTMRQHARRVRVRQSMPISYGSTFD